MIWHNSTTNEVVSELGTDIEKGLSSAEVEARLNTYGKNELAKPKGKGLAGYILNELKSFFNIALIVVALVYFILTIVMKLSGILESIVIIFAVIAGAVINAFLKLRASSELESLQTHIGSYATVIRNGDEVSVHSSMLVPGDIMVLKTGDYIKADGRLLDSYALTCEEFRITGESAPTEKRHDALFEDITPMPYRQNMVYSGSVVLNGRGLAVVTETALHTEMGMKAEIARHIDSSETTLFDKLSRISKTADMVSIICLTLIFFIGIIANFSATNVSFAVTVIGNLLLALSVYIATASKIIPSLIYFARAASANRLRKNGIMVAKAKVAEELKDISVICADKTGTITTDFLTVVKIFNGNKTIDLKEHACDEASTALLRLGLICSNFSHDEHTERHSNSMERAIESACIAHAGMSKTDIDGLYPKIAELPFDSERMLMTTVTAINGNPIAIIKGAPEVITSRCTNVEQNEIEKISNEYAKEGLKVIAIAVKPLNEIPANPNSDELENELTFVGILGFEDEIDRNTAALCKECAQSGIKTVMVTGDHFDTAVAMGIKAGIINDESAAISGEMLSEIDDTTLVEEIDKYSVFARITPEDKLRIVKAFKARGEKVLMTGDSINDAQAILEADIGCALGQTASDMVKDSAELVIDDNRFDSIVLSIKESARIFTNVKKALSLLFTAQLVLLDVVILGLLIFGTSPINPSAALLMSFISLCLPLFAILTENSKKALSLSGKGVKIFDKPFLLRFIAPAIFITIMALIGFGLTSSGGVGAACTTAFGIIAICELVNALCISHTKIIISKNALDEKIMSIIFGIALLLVLLILATPIGSLLSLNILSSTGWLIILFAMIGTFIIDESIKIFNLYFKK